MLHALYTILKAILVFDLIFVGYIIAGYYKRTKDERKNEA